MLTLAIGDIFVPERAVDLPSKFRKLLAPQPNNTPSNSKINQVICLGNITNSSTILQFLTNISPQFNLVKGEFDNPVVLSQQLSLLNKNSNIPLYNRFVHDNLKIGYTNGFQVMPRGDPLALSAFARELDVDVLIWGSTHKVEAYTLDGKFFINPGSATGAFGFDWPENDDEEEEEEQEEDTSKDDREKSNKGVEENEDNPENHDSNTKETKDPESKAENDTSTSVLDFKQSLQEVSDINSNIPSFCLLDTHGSTCILYIYTQIDGEVKVDKVTYTKD